MFAPFRSLLPAIFRRFHTGQDNPETVPPQAPPDTGAATAILSAAIDPLLAVMDHPRLGGPGFLTVQLRSPTGGAAVTAQFPNINEALYRRIVRGELDPSELIQSGVPPALLDQRPDFETESGGMVLLTVPVPPLPLGAPPASPTARAQLLNALASSLERRYPDLTVRCLGWDILLAPVRREGIHSFLERKESKEL